MKTKHTLLLLVSGALLAACNDSEPQAPKTSPLQTLRARIEQTAGEPQPASPQLSGLFGENSGPSLHTIIQQTPVPHPIVWRRYDDINVHFDTDPEGIMRLYQLEGTGNTSSGTFSLALSLSSNPDIPSDQIPTLPDSYTSLIAAYPGRSIVITPEESEVIFQTPVEIFRGIEAISDFAMIGSAQAGQPINFYCPFGLIQLPVTGNVAIKSIDIDTSTQQKEIAGYFLIDKDSYVPSFHKPIFEGTQFTVTWASQSSLQLTSTPEAFYAILPPATYEAGTLFRFNLTDGSTIERRTKQPFTVTRAQILNLPTLNVTR